MLNLLEQMGLSLLLGSAFTVGFPSGEIYDENFSVSFTEEELQSFFQAYRVLENFVEKILPAEEIYDQNFLKGLREAVQEIRTGQTRGHSLDDFIS